ncbi:MAG: TIGR02281 family clan AA aspartic protease [Sphingomonas sp.]|uniref:retropepsin-like aspartic protease family protein n=1 Tax=Sphingomonas sp. TaxID=28214 RepID=UPI0022731305|nr:TIGR02281 family clan AA aspartic protease [Sphingomonas sp.]MCX8476470.1 TIGR02281 family clan AA aspartic protease [Sphingomonas sp.]
MALAAADAAATDVFVTSISPTQVQLIVDGKVARTLRPNEVSPEGVKVLEIKSGAVVLQVDGRPVQVGLGQSTVRATVLRADPRGHFVVTAMINNVPVPAMIDTGATTILVNWNQALQMGIDPRQGQRVMTQTANGPSVAWVVTFARVQIGDIVLSNVPGAVTEGGAEKLSLVLIGMSFLRHVEMRRSGDTMTLSRPAF